MAQGRIFINWRLVGLAAMGAVGGPAGAVMGDLPVVSRLVLAAVGLLTWWYLFRCVMDTWGARFVSRDGRPRSTVVPWLVFVITFYMHGLLLGLAWRDCGTGEPGTNMVHVLTSATLVGGTSMLTWAVLIRGRTSGAAEGAAGRVAVLAVLVAVVLAVVLLWPAMAIWHLLASPAGGLCGPNGTPGWWPAVLSLG